MSADEKLALIENKFNQYHIFFSKKSQCFQITVNK
jgi:hypothetical protein